MVLIAHIILALASIALTTIALIQPSRAKLYGCYGLAAGTLASGIVLIASTSGSIVRACIAGLTYFAIVSVGIAIARTRMRRIVTAE